MADMKTIMSWLEGLAEPNWRMFHSDSEVQTIAKETLDILHRMEVTASVRSDRDAGSAGEAENAEAVQKLC